jgi:hypothetical protein
MHTEKFFSGIDNLEHNALYPYRLTQLINAYGLAYKLHEGSPSPIISQHGPQIQSPSSY